ncbi:hypothetical protein BLOT_014642 [Blomia tropicalis]|nr:hypothetical protein BLOT_014642 [Blomia tropicalis]
MNDEQHELVEYTNVKHTSLNFDNFILPIHGKQLDAKETTGCKRNNWMQKKQLDAKETTGCKRNNWLPKVSTECRMNK